MPAGRRDARPRTGGPLRSIGFALLAAAALFACGGEAAPPPSREEAAAETGTATPAAEPSYPGEVTEPVAAQEPPALAASDPEAAPPEPGVPPPPDAVRVYLVEVEAGAAGEDGEPAADSFGCGDRLRAVEVPVAAEGLDTAGRVAAALGALLAARGEQVPAGLYNALARSQLAVERVEAVPGPPGVFRVHLAGGLVLGGVCDHPRVRAQLEATARQFAGVEEVELLLDGRPIDAFLTGRG